MSVTAPVRALEFSGRWVGPYRTLDNGDVQTMIIELKQSGNHLSGTCRTLDSDDHVTGRVNAEHFELFRQGQQSHLLMSGSLRNGSLLVVDDGNRAWIARAAVPADEFPRVAHQGPPPLRKVPNNGLARLPPMGWNSWNRFQNAIDDRTVRAIADAMVSTGMRDAGYVYLNIDDTWEGVRDEYGNLHANHKFPDMRALADYVHARGLRFGLYSSPGPRTCAGYPGSFRHESQDAQTFADWGVDYLKYDWCSASSIYGNMYTTSAVRPVYQQMAAALASAGRPIVYSLSAPVRGVETWAANAGANLWRTTVDIQDSWSSMIANIEMQTAKSRYAGPGRWNDPDMLEVGNGRMTDTEYRTHMSLWALAAAPLLAGNDIRSMSDATRLILLNKEVIAIDQDPLGKQATPVRHGPLEVWVKPLADGGAAVGLVNLTSKLVPLTFHLDDLRLSGAVRRVRDLWKHEYVHLNNDIYTSTVAAHGVVLLRVWTTEDTDIKNRQSTDAAPRLSALWSSSTK